MVLTTHMRVINGVTVEVIHTPAPPFTESDETDSSDGSYTSFEHQLGLEYFIASPERYSTYPYNPDGTWQLPPPTQALIEHLNSDHITEEEMDEEVPQLADFITRDELCYNPREPLVDIRAAQEDGRLSVEVSDIQLANGRNNRARAWVKAIQDNEDLSPPIPWKSKVAPGCGMGCVADRNVYCIIPDHNWNNADGPAIRKQQHQADLFRRVDYLDLAMPATAQHCFECVDRATFRVQAGHVRFDNTEVEEEEPEEEWDGVFEI